MIFLEQNLNLSDLLPWRHRVTNQSKPKPHRGQWWVPAFGEKPFTLLRMMDASMGAAPVIRPCVRIHRSPQTPLNIYHWLQPPKTNNRFHSNQLLNWEAVFNFIPSRRWLYCCSCWRNTKWPDFWSIKRPALESGGTWGQELFWRFMCQ